MEAPPSTVQVARSTTAPAARDRATIRAMGIAEIRLMIIEQLKRGDVARLAAVNKTWFYSCTEAIWSGRFHTSNRRYLSRASDREEISIDRLLNVNPCRTQFYADFIHNVGFGSFTFERWVLGLEGNYPQATFQLPQLTRLEADVHLDGFRMDSTEVINIFSRTFLSTSLKHLQICQTGGNLDSPWPRLPMEAFLSRMTNLETLELEGRFSFVGFSRLVQTLPNLQNATYRNEDHEDVRPHHLSKALWYMASRTRALDNVKLEFPSPYGDDLEADMDRDNTETPDEPMQSAISNLELHHVGPLFRGLLLMHIEPASIVDLDLSMDFPIESDAITLKSCGLEVISRFKNLTDLNISAYIPEWTKLHPNFLLQIARACSHMQSVSIIAMGTRDENLDIGEVKDDVLEKVARFWPKLQDIRVDGDRNSVTWTLAGWRSLILHCPEINLRYSRFGRRLDVEQIQSLEKDVKGI